MKIKNNIILFLLILIIILRPSVSRGYSPEITGNYEVGDRSYIDIYEIEDEELNDELNDIEDLLEEELAEELVDKYSYEKIWLRYRQQLSSSDYYYIKGQYYNKEYLEKLNYNNITWDLWTNYTFRITDQLRNKIMLDLRNKDYYENPKNTYNQLRIKYQLDYKINDKNDCTLFLQRQWKGYPDNEAKDNLYDRVSLSWDWDISNKFSLSSGLQYDWTSFKPISESTDKNSRKFNIGFEWKL